jgi:hypothetical protein
MKNDFDTNDIPNRWRDIAYWKRSTKSFQHPSKGVSLHYTSTAINLFKFLIALQEEVDREGFYRKGTPVRHKITVRKNIRYTKTVIRKWLTDQQIYLVDEINHSKALLDRDSKTPCAGPVVRFWTNRIARLRDEENEIKSFIDTFGFATPPSSPQY